MRLGSNEESMQQAPPEHHHASSSWAVTYARCRREIPSIPMTNDPPKHARATISLRQERSAMTHLTNSSRVLAAMSLWRLTTGSFDATGDVTSTTKVTSTKGSDNERDANNQSETDDAENDKEASTRKANSGVNVDVERCCPIRTMEILANKRDIKLSERGVESPRCSNVHPGGAWQNVATLFGIVGGSPGALS